MNKSEGRITKNETVFRREVSVAINIQASPKAIWALLTDAAAFPRWNSTVQSIEGNISLGQKIKLRAPYAPGRTFKLKVSEFVPETRMVWRDGAAPMFRGVRTYKLQSTPNGSTDFTMVEVFSGLMVPIIAKSLPDFGPLFERYASDLKRAAEG